MFLTTILVGAAVPFTGLHLSKGSTGTSVLRPPGAVDEETFLALCARCGRCVSVCPTSAIRLQGFENGLKNVFTPKIVPIRGYCISPVNNCQNCIEVCPTKVLKPIELEGISTSELSNVLKMGTAFLNRASCIPYAELKPCLACKEICPVHGAITLIRGRGPKKPVINHDLCVGCGACEYTCPAKPKAVIVTSRYSKRLEWDK